MNNNTWRLFFLPFWLFMLGVSIYQQNLFLGVVCTVWLLLHWIEYRRDVRLQQEYDQEMAQIDQWHEKRIEEINLRQKERMERVNNAETPEEILALAKELRKEWDETTQTR